jgi:hypothetical protein
LACVGAFPSRGDAFVFGALLGGLAGGIFGIIIVNRNMQMFSSRNGQVEYNIELSPYQNVSVATVPAISFQMKIY